MTRPVPRLAPTLALDFPTVPEFGADSDTDVGQPHHAPPPRLVQPRVWARETNTCSAAAPCVACQEAAARMVARVVGPFAPGSLADLESRCL